METIRNYIENLFRNYPNTPRVQKAREELLGIMEDKYNELKSQGRSENEAIGIVISEFGNMDEIASELEADTASLNTGQEDGREVYPMNLGQAKEYIEKQVSSGGLIALGVALCILSPSIACIMDFLGKAKILPYRLTDMFGGAGLMCVVAVGVGILIIQGIAVDGREKKVKGKKVLLDYSTKSYVESEMEAYRKEFGIRITVGVIFCIVSILPIITLDALWGDAYDEIAGIFLFAFVAAGVSCFITAGMRQGAYETLLGIGEASPRAQKKNKVMSVVAPVYWLSVTLIYLMWSFFGTAWGFSWIIWPFAGIAFGIVAVIVKAVTEKEK